MGTSPATRVALTQFQLAMPKALPFRGVYGPYERETASGVSHFIQFERPGRRSRKSLTLKAKTPSLAFAEAVDYGRRFEAGLFDPWKDATEAVTLAEGVRRWLAHNPRLSKHTLKERRIALERFAAELPLGGRLDPRDVAPEHVRAFTHAPHLKASTQEGYFSKVRACFNWLKAEGYVRENPCDELQKPKPRKRPPKFLSRYEFAALLAQAHSDAHTGKGPAWMPDLIELGVATGLRRGELCALRWCDVDLRNGRLYARSYVRSDGSEHRTKSGHDRPVPIFAAARVVLERLQAERANEDETAPVLLSERRRHLYGNYVRKSFAECRDRARLPGWVTPHALRHTFASWLVSDGTPIFHVSKWLGHSSVTTTQIYAYLAPNEKEWGGVFTMVSSPSPEVPTPAPATSPNAPRPRIRSEG